jgi:putative ABC transport system permease protein
VGVVSTYRPALAIADLKLITPTKGSTLNKNGITVSLLGIDPVAFPQVSSLRFEQGSSAKAFSTLAAGRGLIINGVFASSAGLKVGDAVPFQTPNGAQTYRVAAIANDFLDLTVVTGYISQANMASDFGKAEDVLLQLNLQPGADRAKKEAQLKAIKQAYPQFAMISGQAYYDQTVGLLKSAFAGMSVLFMFLAIPSLIAMLNTLANRVIERTRELACCAPSAPPANKSGV